MRVLGIDPGSRITGFGVVEVKSQQPQLIACGAIKVGGGEFPERLKTIFDDLSECIDRYTPDEVAIERVFVSRNADSALKLGQARGAAIVAAVNRDLPVFEYAARQIKQAMVGRGAADKHQVQHMVKVLLSISDDLQEDAADALGVALCHINTRATQQYLDAAGNGWQ